MHSGEAVIKITTFSKDEDWAKSIFRQAVANMRRTVDVESVEVTLEPKFFEVADNG